MIHPAPPRGVDGAYAWGRLALSLLLGTVGGFSMWAVVVALPAMQAEFGVARASATLPYTLAMVGLATGNVFMGRLVDRVGIFPPLLIAGTSLAIGYTAASQAGSLLLVTAAFFVPITMLGSSVTFGPLMADVSHWFVRRRGLAVSICAAGNYIAGAIWPPVLEWGISRFGWRHTLLTAGVLAGAVIVAGAFALRRPTPHVEPVRAPDAGPAPGFGFDGLSPRAVQVLLCIAGVACCVAMAMPQVQMVAYCGDLGYGAARGAEMLSLMLGFGVVSRITSGFVADRLGGLATLLLGSLLQLLALVLFLGFNSLASLYVISALFGLFQGGLVPSYAIIVREFFPAREAGARIGAVLTATMLGMALGGWMSGAIFDWAGNYAPAFLNGIGWNVLNAGIALLLIWRASGGRRGVPAPA